MALTDSFSGDIKASLIGKLRRTGGGSHTGVDSLASEPSFALTDGTGANQAAGWFSATFTATTGGVTISLASATDPLGAAGDDTPTASPDETQLRALLIYNRDTTNYVTVTKGANALTCLGTTPGIIIPAGGFFLLASPIDGLGNMTDGTDDEIIVTANTANCSCEITYVFG